MSAKWYFRYFAGLLVWLFAQGQFGDRVLAQVKVAPNARVVALRGTLTVKRARQQAQILQLGGTVESGDELSTDEDSEATIQTNTRATVQIYPASHVLFSERSADIQEFLHLFFGSLKVHIQKITGWPNPHRITTPTAIIGVRGTTFSVFVDDEDATLVAVDDGIVSAANVQYPLEEVVLQRGQRTWVRHGQPPTQAQAFRGRSERADLIPVRGGAGSMRGNTGAAQQMMKPQTEPTTRSSGVSGMHTRSTSHQ